MYAEAAQYNYPAEHVTKICKAIDGAPAGTDVIGRIVAGVVAFSGNWTCNDTIADDYSSEIIMGWSWQVSYYSISKSLASHHFVVYLYFF